MRGIRIGLPTTVVITGLIVRGDDERDFLKTVTCIDTGLKQVACFAATAKKPKKLLLLDRQ